MASIDKALPEFAYLEILATRETPIHRLDPRAKLLATLVFVAMVVSFDRYAISALVPFFLFPLVLVARGGLPAGFLLRKTLLALPFALLVGLFNPFFDRTPLLALGPLMISGGWVSFASIILRALLTVGASLALIAVTGFTGVCLSLERLGFPRVFAVQLLFLYRYLFILVEEGGRTVRARELRSCGARGQGIASYSSLVGNLLLRTWDRAERIHRAMLSRGFQGEFHLRRTTRFGWRELLFVGGWSALFIVCRLVNIPVLIGTIVTGVAG